MNKNTQPRRRESSEAYSEPRELRLLEFNESPQDLDQSLKLKLEPVVTRDEFGMLKSEWDMFLFKTQTPSPFLSWDYLDVWWDVYGEKGFDFRFLIARDTEKNIVGAAPLMISQKGAFPGTRSNFRHLSFIGGLGDTTGESLELSALPGYEVLLGEAVAEHILRSMRGQWDVLYLSMIPHDSRSTNAMIKKLAEAGIVIKTVCSTASPILPITTSWEDYMSAQTVKVRERIAEAFTNGVDRSSDLELLRAGREIPLEVAYEEMIKLSKLNKNHTFSRIFETALMIDFHWKLAPRLLEQDKLFFGLVKMEGQFAGAVYDFLDERKMWARQALWDPQFESRDIKLILNTWSDKTAFNRGLQEIDYLLGTSGRDLNETRYARTLNIYEASCPRSLGGTLFSLARGIDRLLQPKN